MGKSRLWCFTNFDLEFNYSSIIKNTTAEYIQIGIEKCPSTEKIHHQGLIYYSGQRGSIKGVAKDLGKCHVEMCKGNLDQNSDYITKDEGKSHYQVIEYGIRPAQGFRTDLDSVKDSILAGEITVDEITVENPNLYHQYGRTLNKLEDIALRKRFRTEMTKAEWIYGKTGTGKSHYAFNNYSPETHYLYPNDGGWWDGYTGQEIVIINEFRGGIMYSELLELLDKWPKTVRRRGREPVPFLAKLVIITSSLHPTDVYQGVLEKDDSIDQLLRRLKIMRFKIKFKDGGESIKMDQKCSEGNTEPQSQNN
jgi:hypothetical protein